ncbi:MAG TPA: SWIM zinc finger family protein [Croceibacterium sp.]
MLSLEKIERLAPDQGSLAAARKLLKADKWPTLQSDGAGLIWGECQGSGATPYRVAVTEADAGYKCTCPSRKFPCKHSLALMWLRADGLAPFASGSPPQWIGDWLGRRRGPPVKPAGEADQAPVRASIAALEDDADTAAPDPEAEARAEVQRERNRAKREALVAEGIAAAEQWIADQLERGLAGFDQRAAQACATLSRRLVDAKASGLANRVATLPAQLFALPEAERGLAAADALARLYLIGQAYTRQDALPEALRADVRAAVGWSVTREALLADAAAERVAGAWRVLAAREEVQPDKLRRIETWLELGEPGGRHAVLLDYVPVGAGASGNIYASGEVLQAELAFYPSPVPLRAQIVAHTGTSPAAAAWTGAVRSLPNALEAWHAALAAKPWLGDWPLAASGVAIRSSGGRLHVVGDGVALPLASASRDAAAPLAEAREVTLFGLWDGRVLVPLLAATPLGEWSAP